MGERLSKFLPVFVGILVPLALIFTNTIWNYTGILLTVACIVWIGFAILLLAPGGTTT